MQAEDTRLIEAIRGFSFTGIKTKPNRPAGSNPLRKVKAPKVPTEPLEPVPLDDF